MRSRASEPFMKRLLLVSVLLAACGGTPKGGTTPVAKADDPGAKPVKTIELEPLRIDVVDGPDGPRAEAYDARMLLEEGNDALMQRRFDEALEKYQHLATDFPDSALVLPALYNSGLALEGK